ncbi:hypothetical protein [Paracoccus ravus]|uniref:capsular polysaccharide export protein, LipB/KpsS family n=1 Tax=Paracoccus ravus TaxID=2447760 RepID=UPI00106EDFB7|nr:hypothetical protein [Paracoccus ravus]
MSSTLHPDQHDGPRPDVILELPEPWFANPDDGHHHRMLYTSLLSALARIEARILLRPLGFGMDEAPREAGPGQLVISYHSRGEGPGVLRFKESYISGHYSMDRLGYAGFSELARHPERFHAEIAAFDLPRGRACVSRLQSDFTQRNLSKYRQPSRDSDALPERYFFFPLQTVDDPVASLAEIDQIDALEAVLRHASSRGVAVIAKRHPLCRAKRVAHRLTGLAAEYPCLQIRDGSVHRYIEQAKAVIGCNSGVLFESLIHGRPVVTFGKSDFRALTVPARNIEEIPAALDAALPPDADAVARFVGWYLNAYCTRADDVDHLEKRILGALSELGATTFRASATTRQMRAFARREKIRRREAIWGRSPIIRLLSRLVP